MNALTQEDNIRPGIYRTSLSNVHGVPGIREPQFESHGVPVVLERLIKGDSIQKRTYFQTVKDFLEAWHQGYTTGQSQFGTSSIEPKGFELFYVNWKPDSPFSKIGEHEGIRMMGDRADLNPIMILGDNNGMNDQKGYLNLGVNDFRNQISLVYRPSWDEIGEGRGEQVDLTSNTLKQFRNDLRYYVWNGQQKFPINSPNILKSLYNMWTAVGINPLEVYKEIENMGFVFPE